MENFEFFNSFLFPYINLVIFLAAAVWLLKKPLKNALAGKRASYVALMEKANLAKEEADRKHRELDARLKALDGEMAKLRSETKASAEAEAKAILAGAESLAEHLKKEAKRIAEAEVAEAKEAIRRDILAQVKQKTAEELSRTLNDATQHQIVKQGLSTLSQVKG